MKVSVLIITYNQERFIGQAIESALMQQTNFDYEIVIGEDCSTDDTRRIVIDYQKRYPDKIRLLLREKNLGLFGKINFIQTLQACRGEYVAVLEGDDYWTSPNKLQKQVDVLDAHSDYAICFHDVQAFDEEKGTEGWKYCRSDQKETSTLEDLLAINFIPTCSVMFRNGLIKEFPDWLCALVMIDWPVHIMNAQHGKIFYIPTVMSAYRIHGNGIWSSKNELTSILEMIRLYDFVDAYLGFRYKKQIKQALTKWNYKLAMLYDAQGQEPAARTHLLKAVFNDPSGYRSLSRGQSAKTLVRMCSPLTYRFVSKCLRSIRPL